MTNITDKTSLPLGLVLTLSVMGAGIVGSFAVGQYRLGAMEDRQAAQDVRLEQLAERNRQQELQLTQVIGDLKRTTEDLQRVAQDLRGIQGGVRSAGGRER